MTYHRYSLAILSLFFSFFFELFGNSIYLHAFLQVKMKIIKDMKQHTSAGFPTNLAAAAVASAYHYQQDLEPLIEHLAHRDLYKFQEPQSKVCPLQCKFIIYGYFLLISPIICRQRQVLYPHLI